MKVSERIQSVIHAMEVGRFSRKVQLLALATAVLSLALLYDFFNYRGFSSVEAMDAAQVAQNLADGRGFSTHFIRPFDLYLLEQHHRKEALQQADDPDPARLNQPHPDLANAPLYPALLAGLFKLIPAHWQIDLHDRIWSGGGRFQYYPPEIGIAVLNQLLLVAVVVLTFLLARRLFNMPVAVLSALLVLGADVLWRFSVSGQSTMLLLVLFLALLWNLVRLEEYINTDAPGMRRLLMLAILSGVLVGMGMLTRYAFGWMILPVTIFLAMGANARRPELAATAFLAFVFTVTPWILRNLLVSGTLFGTAGYAVVEGTFVFPGSQLMHSINPDLSQAQWLRPYLRKLVENARHILEGDLLRLAGGWMTLVFLVGLLVGLQKQIARRLFHFSLLSLGLLILVQAMGKTGISDLSPEINSENLLVLLTPLLAIFASAFFLKLVDQLNPSTPEVRVGIIVVFAAICCHPLVLSLFPPRADKVAYPPYYPPDIQKLSGWIRPNELLMSDIPWAVAWYGDRNCTWTTLNSQDDFFRLNDNVKHVSGLYLTLNTLDSKLFTECLYGGKDSWSLFIFNTVAKNQLPTGFPLRVFPLDSFNSGFFLTDRVRWETE